VSEPVKTRTYRSPVRAHRAERTRLAVLGAARDLLAERGYDSTAVADVAARAGVSVDTVYSSVGRKPQLAMAVIDMVLGSADEPIAAEERDYVRAVRAAPTSPRKLEVYAAALGRLMPRLAPLMDALRRAGETDADCARVWGALSTRRADNMLLLAADLRQAGGVRSDLADRDVADVVWSTNGPEYFLLLRSRGWSAERYATHLADLWCRMLLTGPAKGAGQRAIAP
jgi:AcrR family transcriptional regulator